MISREAPFVLASTILASLPLRVSPAAYRALMASCETDLVQLFARAEEYPSAIKQREPVISRARRSPGAAGNRAVARLGSLQLQFVCRMASTESELEASIANSWRGRLARWRALDRPGHWRSTLARVQLHGRPEALGSGRRPAGTGWRVATMAISKALTGERRLKTVAHIVKQGSGCGNHRGKAVTPVSTRTRR
jgi:hypothetical protein